jgi:hypothetical protein
VPTAEMLFKSKENHRFSNFKSTFQNKDIIYKLRFHLAMAMNFFSKYFQFLSQIN